MQGEIDAREDSFKGTAESGQRLLDSKHPAVEEVKEKLVNLANEKTALLELWETRRVLYEQCMDLQLFYRDTEQADAWMAKQEVAGWCHLKGFSLTLSLYYMVYITNTNTVIVALTP